MRVISFRKLLLQKLRFQFVSFVHTHDENKSLQSERLKGAGGEGGEDAKLLKSRLRVSAKIDSEIVLQGLQAQIIPRKQFNLPTCFDQRSLC